MSKLNVLFLNSWYPNEIKPYNGNFVQQHAKAVSLYANVICLQTQSRVQDEEFEITKHRNDGVWEIVVYYKKITSTSLIWLLKKKNRQHKAFVKGFEVVKEEFLNVDIVHLNVTFPAGLFALHLNKKYNIPYIITEHSTVFLKINAINHTLTQKYFIKKIAKKASFICPVSKDLKQAMLGYNIKSNFKVIPNVVNTKFFKYVPKKEFDPIKILHISSLKQDHKNGKGMVNVIRKLSEIRQDFTFLIISDGELEPIIEYAKSIGLKDAFFKIEGGKTTEEIAIAMQQHHLFLLFSNYENLPCVISESLVSGLPVISSDVGGINEMLTEENGVLIAAMDEIQLFEKLNFMLSNLSNYDNKKIAEAAALKYSYEVVGKQFLEIYKVVLN